MYINGFNYNYSRVYNIKMNIYINTARDERLQTIVVDGNNCTIEFDLFDSVEKKEAILMLLNAAETLIGTTKFNDNLLLATELAISILIKEVKK